MVEREAIEARLRRAETILAEADRLLQRRRVALGGPGEGDVEDRLLQGVRELAAVLRDILATGGDMAPVSSGHAAELAATAEYLDQPPRRPRPRRGG